METNGYRLLLPEGTLDYFIISDVKESSTDIVFKKKSTLNELLFIFPTVFSLDKSRKLTTSS